jgi:hypothetical protein
VKSIFGLVLLAVGVMSLCVGTWFSSGGKHAGWAAIVAGGGSCGAAYVLMRPPRPKENEEV